MSSFLQPEPSLNGSPGYTFLSFLQVVEVLLEVVEVNRPLPEPRAPFVKLCFFPANHVELVPEVGAEDGEVEEGASKVSFPVLTIW
jgi:hypothetical protein